VHSFGFAETVQNFGEENSRVGRKHILQKYERIGAEECQNVEPIQPIAAAIR
jgi:hypothetical protein